MRGDRDYSTVEMGSLKEDILESVGDEPWFRGCGIALDRKTGARVVTVSVADFGEWEAKGRLKGQFPEQEYAVRVVGELKALPATAGVGSRE